MENKDLKERKEGFKQVASQTIPVMGLEPENDKENDKESESCDTKLHCTGCVAHCADACISRCEETCKAECEDNCYNGGMFYKG